MSFTVSNIKVATSYGGVPLASGAPLQTGTVVNFTLTFSATPSVMLDGNGDLPTLTLDDGGVAIYTGTDANGDMLFSYTVLPGDTSANLTVTGLQLNGATVTGGQAPLSLLEVQTLNTQIHPISIATADVNGDGYPDVIVANQDTSNLSIFLNEGNGAFASAGAYAVTLPFGPNQSFPDQVITADLNGDGKPDLIVRGTGGSLSVILNTGFGGFLAPHNYTIPSGAGQVAALDINGDGAADLVVTGSQSGEITVLLNYGDGSFRQGSTVHANVTGFNQVALADLLSDGKVDLIAQEGQILDIFNGNGDGTFQAGQIIWLQDSANGTAVVVDLNGDGRPDIVIPGLGGYEVLLNNGDGTFTDQATWFNNGDRASAIAVADINGDGIPDLVITDSNNAVSVALGHGDGSFGARQFFTTGQNIAQDQAIDAHVIYTNGQPEVVVADHAMGAYYFTDNFLSVLQVTGGTSPLDTTSVAQAGAATGLSVKGGAVSVGLLHDTGNAGDDVTSDPTLIGQGFPDATLTVYDNGRLLTTLTAGDAVGSNGGWQFTPTLTPGSHNIVVNDSNNPGGINHTYAAGLTFIYDPAPVALTPSFGLTVNQSLLITGAQLAAPGIAGQSLSVLSGSADLGRVGILNGQLDYSPFHGVFEHIVAGGSVTDTVHATVTDQYGMQITTSFTVTVTNPATYLYGGQYGGASIQGTSGADVITAYGWNNVIHGNGGNDTINAGQGNATVYTGIGDAIINLNGYNDVVQGGDIGGDRVTVAGSQGNLSATFGAGALTLSMTGYNNAVQAGDGDDSVSGGQGNSTVRLGNGSDWVKLSGYNNQITVGNGGATIVAGAGNDSVTSGQGNDTISLSGWNNWLDAGGGANMVMINGGGNGQIVLHLSGDDQISGYTPASNDVFDLRSVLSEAQLSLGGDISKLAAVLHVSNTAGNAALQFDPSGRWQGGSSTLAVLNGVGSSITSLADLTSHGAIRIA